MNAPTWNDNADGSFTHTNGARLAKTGKVWAVSFKGTTVALPKKKASFDHADRILAAIA